MCEDVSFMNRIFLQESLIYLLFIYLRACVCVLSAMIPAYACMPNRLVLRAFLSGATLLLGGDSIDWATVEEIWMERCRA